VADRCRGTRPRTVTSDNAEAGLGVLVGIWPAGWPAWGAR